MLPIFLLTAGSIAYLGRTIRKKRTASGSGSPSDPALKTPMKRPVPKDPFAELDEEVDHYLPVSAGALGLATAGSLFFSPLSIISVPVSLYVSWPIFETAYREIRGKRKLKAELIDSFAVLVSLAGGYYFVTALSCCAYFAASKVLSKTRDHTGKTLINIFEEQPRHVWILRDNAEIEIRFDELSAGDIFIVNAGEVIPADGIVTEGAATVDQHMLTGESLPCEKTVGEQVFAATVVLAGRVYIQASCTGSATLAAQIGDILNNTAKFELSIQTRSEEVADKSVLPTLAAGTLALATLGRSSSAAVICANFSEVNRLASPLAMLNFLGTASKNSILIKDGRALEAVNEIDTVVFDKTGTLTLNQFSLSGIYPADGMEEDELLKYAAAAEYKQTHPVARTILEAAEERNIVLPEPSDNSYEIGYGIKVEINGRSVLVGSNRFMDMQEVALTDTIRALQEHSHEQGCSTVYVAVDHKLAGMLELRPKIRPEATEIIRKLRRRNLSVCILSGDQENPTRQLARQLGIDQYFSGVLPHEKSEIIEQLQQEGKKVCFIGDGINDSIALKKANVSISLSGASTAAVDTAQIILMDTTLVQLDRLFELSRDFTANQKTSMAAVFVPGILCAGGIFFLHVGVLGSMIFYNVSVVAGVTNALLPSLKKRE
ncbi:Heavy metal translocating P-type ATPase [Candidatus Electrothrix gigas]